MLRVVVRCVRRLSTDGARIRQAIRCHGSVGSIRRAPGKCRMVEERVDNTKLFRGVASVTEAARLDSACWEQMLQYGCSKPCETASCQYRGSGGHRRDERGRSRT